MSQYWQGRRDYRFWLEFQWQPTSHYHYLALEVTTNKCIIINHLKHKRKGGGEEGTKTTPEKATEYAKAKELGKMLWLNFFFNQLSRCLHLRAYLSLLCASTREHIILGAWQQPGPRHFVPRAEAIPPGTGKHSATRFLFVGSPRRPEPRAGGPICLSCRAPPRRMNLYSVSRAFTAATDSAPEAPWRRRVFASRGKSLFAPRALTSLSRGGERDALPLITREAVQGEARGGEAARKSPHRDYQMWQAFHLWREVTFCSRILPWLASKGHNRERIPFLFSADKERAMPLEAKGQHQ